MNEYRLSGFAISKPELIESEKGSKYCYLKLNVKRNYQQNDGNELFDTFKITCFKAVAQEANERIAKDTKLIIKGHVQQVVFNKDTGETSSWPELICDKIEYI